jgi:hypothetical protein
MLVKVGDPIQLNLQLEDGNETKYPRAILRNQFGTLLPESPVDLTHSGDGLYQNDSVFMPDTQEVTATFKVYDDSLRTVLSNTYTIELDVFCRDNSFDLLSSFKQLPGDILGVVDDSGSLGSFLDDIGSIVGDIEDDGSLAGYIEEFELIGVLDDSGSLSGIIDIC